MKKSLFFGMAALLLAGVSSCSSDDILVQDPNKPLDEDRTFFANIDILSTEALSRADEYQNVGDKDGVTDDSYKYDPDKDPGFNAGDDSKHENDVKTIYLIFYDEEGNRVSTTQVRKDNGNEDSGRNPSENKLYSGVVQIDVKHGQLPPAYVMCFINPITSMNFEINPDFATLESLQKTTKPRIIDDNNYFAMSKSVYYGVNRASEAYKNADEETKKKMQTDPTYFEKIVATPIGEGQLFDTVEEARKAVGIEDGTKDDNAIIDIYVERYAAKVNFKIDYKQDNSNIAPLTLLPPEGTNLKPAVLKFVPEYWAVNAYESETYICKSFLGEDLTEDMSYQVMNTALGGDKAFKWNNPELHRSYWAQTPGYYKARYPRVADDITDIDDEDERNSTFGLGYYSYQEMVDNAQGNLIDKSRAVTIGETSTIYARENTVAGSALHTAFEDPMASPKAAVASAVLVGHYTVQVEDVNGGQPKEYGPEDSFYVMGNATNGYTFFKDDEVMTDYFINTTIRFSKTNKATGAFFNYGILNFGFKANDEEAYRKLFVVEHPREEIRKPEGGTEAVVDSRFVTIQLNKEAVLAEDAPALYAEIDGVYTQVTADNFNKVNQQMYYAAGTVQGFKGGKAFFNIPIKHLGFYRADNDNVGKMGTEKNFDWNATRSGDFGLVRNHIYTIEVESISGLGNGITNFDDPIVPPTDPNEHFIGARIVVLNWAVVPTQKVQL